MPITPLYFVLLAPVNYFFPKNVNNASFVAANVIIDWGNIQAALQDKPLLDHYNWLHTFIGAWAVFALISVVCIPFIQDRMAWYLGAFWGAFTHIALDMLVHVDMFPFMPLQNKPFYIGEMQAISLILVPFLVWWLF